MNKEKAPITSPMPRFLEEEGHFTSQHCKSYIMTPTLQCPERQTTFSFPPVTGLEAAFLSLAMCSQKDIFHIKSVKISVL
jgi:hypothetical protein